MRGKWAFWIGFIGAWLLAATSSLAQSYVYYGYSIRADARITLVGFEDNTQYSVVDINNQQTLRQGILNRVQSITFTIGRVTPFKIVSTRPISAHLWYDCCNFGGSTSYPAVEGFLRTGTEFIFVIPVLRDRLAFLLLRHPTH